MSLSYTLLSIHKHHLNVDKSAGLRAYGLGRLGNLSYLESLEGTEGQRDCDLRLLDYNKNNNTISNNTNNNSTNNKHGNN